MKDSDTRYLGPDIDFAGGIAGHEPSSEESFNPGSSTHYSQTGVHEDIPNLFCGAEGFAGGVAGHDTGEIPKLTPEMLGLEP